MKNELKEMIIRDDKNGGDWGHESEESQRDYERQISDQVFKYPGCAVERWGGWVWRVNMQQQEWSKRQTRHQCERAVYEVVERLGIEEAFDLYVTDGEDDAEVQP